MGERRELAGADSDVQWDTITIYEQILAANPADGDALGELFRACLAVGETERAYGYGVGLGRAALKGGDRALIQSAYELLSPHTAADASVRAVVSDLATPLGISPKPRLSAAAAAGGVASRVVGDEPVREAPAPETVDTGVASIIALVSKILENMPDDRESLAVLATAYLKMGDGVQAANSFSRLAEVLIRDQDREEAASVLAKLEALKQVAPEATQAAGRLFQFLNPPLEKRGSAGSEPVAEPAPVQDARIDPASLVIDASRRRAVLADEMELLWDLQQQGLVTEVQYAVVVRDLTELTSSDSITTISALHGLSFRGFVGLDELLIQLAAKALTPVITLGGFDLQSAVFGALPLDYLTFQGVIPFEKLGGEALVAILNPFSQRLRRELAAALGCPCHFFLIPPADFDIALEVVKNRYKAASEG